MSKFPIPIKTIVLLVVGVVIGAVVMSFIFSAGGPDQRGVTVSQFKAVAPAEIPMPDMARADVELMPSMGIAEEGFGAVGGEADASTAAGEVGSERVIKTARLTMQVDDAEESMEKAKAVAEEKQGFVLSASVSGTEKGERTARVTLRVPVAEFEATVAALKELATLLETENITGQDVTEEFTDLESRIKNAKAEEEQYLEIMDRATKIEDVLKVAARLADVRGRIEQLEGRKQYLTNRTDYSTITAVMQEEAVVHVPTSKWRPLQVAKEAARFLVAALQVIVNTVIIIAIVGVGLLIPILLVVWLGFLLIRRIVRKLTRKK